MNPLLHQAETEYLRLWFGLDTPAHQSASNACHALAVVAAYSRGRYEGFHMLVDLATYQEVPGGLPCNVSKDR